MRKAGILLPVSALPTMYGTGDFGPEAYRFVDRIRECGFRIWQILPIQPLGYGNSPYQTYSSFAGDSIFISPEILIEKYGLSPEDSQQIPPSSRIDYEETRTRKDMILRKAYRNFRENDDFRAFSRKGWVRDYAVFRTLKSANGNRPWFEWPDCDREWIHTRRVLPEHEDEIRYQTFIQYEFMSQWNALRKYANDCAVEIMGDIPFYVGHDSVDVWANQESFLLDRRGMPTVVAGVPPDYFSKEGQRWGNPVFNWDYLRADNFKYLCERYLSNISMFDILRIDHFRAFDTYWSIPSRCPTAVEGEWHRASGYEFFDTLLSLKPDASIVVEDLGDMFSSVSELRDHYGFKGMKILQFELDPHETNNRFPDRENLIVYTGTHDNMPVEGWFESLGEDERKRVRKKLSISDTESVSRALVRRCMSSVADYAIVQMQDILALGNEARMNTPGTCGSPDWEWKLQDWAAFDAESGKIKALIRENGR